MLDILNEARVPMQSESAPSMPIPQSTPNQPTPLKQPTDVQPMFTQPVDSQPMNTQPMNAQPMNAQPMDAQPMNAQPMNAQPIFMPQPFPPNFTPNIPNQPLNPPPVPMQQALNANNAPMQQPFPPSFTPYMPDQPVTNPGVHAPYIPPRPMNMPQYQQPVYASYRSTPVKERYIPSPPDGIMAYFMIILGYLFTRYILFRWTGWGVSVQILLMLILTVWYGFSSAALRGEKLGRNAWLWSGVTLAIALSYAFFLAPGINVYRTLFLIMAYLQLILHLRPSSMVQGATSNHFFFDMINALLVIPFSNFALLFLNLRSLFSRNNKTHRYKILPMTLGVIALIPIFGFTVPLLLTADAGFFRYAVNKLFPAIIEFLSPIPFFLTMFSALPVILYICGLHGGVVNERRTKSITKQELDRLKNDIAFVHPITIQTCYIGVLILYFLFIATQFPYLFSVIAKAPEPLGYLTYAEFARQGFTELLIVSMINLVLLWLGTFLLNGEKGKIIKFAQIILCVVTEIIILSAFSKFALYVGNYGLTLRRILPCLAMLTLAVIFIGVIVRQFREFSIMRFVLLCGTVLMLVLSWGNWNGIAASYNADRYLDGTLPEFDVDAAVENGPAALPAIRRVLEKEKDLYNIYTLENAIEDLEEDIASRSATIYSTLR